MMKLPKESESQEIGHLALMAFKAKHPTSWRPKDIDGDDDVGLDQQIQVVYNNQYISMFHAQIKGSMQTKNGVNKSLNAEKTFYSVPLEISTLNYYIKIGYPVMLIFADLAQVPDNPRKCEVFYLWIDDELKNLLCGKENLNHLGVTRLPLCCRVPS